MSRLDRDLIAAHARGDLDALITLYTQAADASNDPAAAGFYLTHAFVFALEKGDPRAVELRARLAADNRI